jgi:malate dehydrogenase (quinone)
VAEGIVDTQDTDILLVGGGIMSATLGMLLRLLSPDLKITMIEQMPDVALESSDALNNAGTGHAGYCELNYTPQDSAGNIQIKRALEINAAYEVSLQFWAYLVKQGFLSSPQDFIQKTPHLSFVSGKENVEFLKQRHHLLHQHHLFKDMQFSEDNHQLKKWMALMMEHRSDDTPMAATYVDYGTDVNFGQLTRQMVAYLSSQPNFNLFTQHKTIRLSQLKQGDWSVGVKSLTSQNSHTLHAKFVFLGAGGAALQLLQKSKIPEGIGYGGFPVSGQWLICTKPEIVEKHFAKVYGKAKVGAPPMSVPHLDTRLIHGKRALLFGPYAGFTTKFLKHGSKFDLAKSIKPKNIKSMLGVGRHHMDLTKYLLKEALQTHEQRMAALREFLPDAKSTDWELAYAGQRVQVIKRCDERGGKLEFGTEIVTSQNGSLATLLGASPGASVSVQAMLDVLNRCFKAQLSTPAWQARLKEMIPSYGESLLDDEKLAANVRSHVLDTLQII